QGKYLNAAAEIQVELSPEDLLLVLRDIEAKLGRVRGERFAPRTIDLDLLLYRDLELDVHTADLDLTVPHPRMQERDFVLRPLAEIGPLAVHPRLKKNVLDLLLALHRRSAGALARELGGSGAVWRGPT